jgi:hypothetical protein
VTQNISLDVGQRAVHHRFRSVKRRRVLESSAKE